jgi:DnaJ-class molecular chaperone
VKQTALTKEIKAAYYQIAKQCHPDMNDNDPKAAERFRKVSEAYEVLCDEMKRAEYDNARFGSSSQAFKQKDYNQQYNHTQDIYNWEDIDPDEIKDFRQSFGQWTDWKGKRQRKTSRKSNDESDYTQYSFRRERTMKISLEEAARGITRELKFPNPLNKFNHFKKGDWLCASVVIKP